MHKKVFNTTFEVSMRLLLALSVTQGVERTLDYIVTVDFVTNYSKEFGVSNMNLHGDNEFSFSEFSTRRAISSDALKKLVLQNMVQVSQTQHGFLYSITKQGIQFCNSLTSDYAKEYRLFAKEANRYMQNKTEKELLNLISKEASKSLRRES